MYSVERSLYRVVFAIVFGRNLHSEELSVVLEGMHRGGLAVVQYLKEPVQWRTCYRIERKLYNGRLCCSIGRNLFNGRLIVELEGICTVEDLL